LVRQTRVGYVLKGAAKMDEEKLREVLSDEDLVKELLMMENEEQVQKALEEKGVELSLDMIRQAGEFIRKVQDGEISQEQAQRLADGELTEDELEEVSGGLAFILFLLFGGSAILSGVIIGEAFGW
jgi:hypothetical protein